MARVSYGPWLKDRLVAFANKGTTMTDLHKELKAGQNGYRTFATFNSFARLMVWYFKLGYIEFTNETEPSYQKGAIYTADTGVLNEPRKYIRITSAGLAAPSGEWVNPMAKYHPQWATGGEKRANYMKEYMREYRKREKEKLIRMGYTPRPRGRPRLATAKT